MCYGKLLSEEVNVKNAFQKSRLDKAGHMS